MIERELDIAMRNGWIAPYPDEVLEAKAKPRANMNNPLSRMARAEEVTGFNRWVEMGVGAAGAGRPDALDRVNFDDGMVNAAEVLGVRPTSIYSDEELADRRAQQQQQQGAQQEAQMAPDLAKAGLDLARTREIASKIGEGGGL